MLEKLYKEGYEKYPLSYVIGQNVFLLVYIGIGFVGMLSIQIQGFPIISTFYALFLVIMLLFVLRKHLCTNCYYYGKRCSTGWGKLSSFIFQKNIGNYGLGIKLANITWMFIALVPTIGITATLILKYSFSNLILLILFILFTLVNFITHKKACEKCKMRFICPASMAKGKQNKPS